jgi:hypothetical protein
MADQHRRVRAAAITGVGQLLGLLGSTLIGVLVAGTLAPSPRVDAFFGANQVFALALYLGQAVRITAPALLVRSGLEPRQLKYATAWLTAGTTALMVGAAVGGSWLVTAQARPDFTRDLLLLAPAAAIHVSCGGIAARLSVAGSFGYAAAAYAMGSVTSGVLLLGAIGPYGAAALAPCLLAGASAVGVIMAVGYRVRFGGGARRVVPAVIDRRALDALDPPLIGPGPDAAALRSVPTATFALRRIGLGAVPALSMQCLITSVTVAAGHVVAGGTALLSYAFLALFAFTTIAITPMSIVLGPELAERWDGRGESLAPIVRKATRLSVVVVLPLVALGFLVGRPLADVLLTALTADDLDQVFAMLAVLAPSLLFTAAATAATVGSTTADRLGVLASWLLPLTVAGAFSAAMLAAVAAPLIVVAIVAFAFAVAFAVASLRVALGRAWRGLAAGLLLENVPIVVPTVVVVALMAPLARSDVFAGCGLAVVALAVHGCVVYLVRRDTVDLLVGAVRARQAA